MASDGSSPDGRPARFCWQPRIYNVGMAQVSTARKISIAGQLLSMRARRSRYTVALSRGVTAAWRSLFQVFRRLWHEVTGFVFLCFAGIGAVAAVREYQRWGAGDPVAARLAAAVCFTALFAWFGVTSFWRARKAQPR